jgi:Asp-tRNA(Asn)/Glu-tRNA(Gln) amidotransferase A subunit family amidase
VLEGPEARVVTDLKTAGALILGKTVSAEFAYFAPGPTRNPHNSDHTPGGSSSGSAAAVAAGLCPLALGTQTGGSLIRPAAFCGIVGFKPTYERISRKGLIPLAPSLDHVGFYTADVEGAIMVASILCKGWRPAIKGTRSLFGVPEGPYLEKTSKEGLNHFRRICDQLSDSGCEILSIEMFKNFDEIVEGHFKLVAGEAALVHRRWFRDYSEIYHETTAEMIKEGQGIGSDVLEACRAGCEKRS